ncbi:hypothetical protein FQN60_007355, partial [Etheostoma spectabile]
MEPLVDSEPLPLTTSLAKKIKKAGLSKDCSGDWIPELALGLTEGANHYSAVWTRLYRRRVSYFDLCMKSQAESLAAACRGESSKHRGGQQAHVFDVLVPV